jgi:hypothetical protein
MGVLQYISILSLTQSCQLHSLVTLLMGKESPVPPFARRLDGVKAGPNVELKRKFATSFWANEALQVKSFFFWDMCCIIGCLLLSILRPYLQWSDVQWYWTEISENYMFLSRIESQSVAYHWAIMVHVLLIFCILGVRWGWVSCYCSLKWAA